MSRILNFVGSGWFTAAMLVYCVGWWIVGDFTGFWAFLTGVWASIAFRQFTRYQIEREIKKMDREVERELQYRYPQLFTPNFSENNKENNK